MVIGVRLERPKGVRHNDDDNDRFLSHMRVTMIGSSVI